MPKQDVGSGDFWRLPAGRGGVKAKFPFPCISFPLVSGFRKWYGPAMNDIMTLKEAALMLRVTTRTLRDHATTGKVPGAKVGGGWRFSRALLMKHLEGGSDAAVEEVTTTTTVRRKP